MLEVVAVSLNIKQGGVPMSTMEILTLGILLIDLIGLVYKISRRR